MQPLLTPLLGLSERQLKAVATGLGLKPFVGKQIADWLYKKGVTEIAQMTNLSKAAREALAAAYSVGRSEALDVQRSKLDGTAKYLFPTREGHFVESVMIPDGERATLCVSSQVGCKMGCAFCMTGRQGYSASLTAGDIINQVASLPERDRLTNIVFMGQGEPLDNFDAVLAATEVLTAPWGYGWSPRRITISTVGLRRGLMRLLEETPCHVAVSLHDPIPAERAEMMPAERALSITETVDMLRAYGAWNRRRPVTAAGVGEELSHQRRLSFEYILFDGLNDSRRHADALLSLLRGLDCRVNLIRFHTIPDTPFRGATQRQLTAFRDYLTSHGLFTTIRASRGEDIMAACGLLSTKRQEEERKQA